MSDLSMLQASLRMKSRSMGVKLIVVCGLALIMAIPALFVALLVDDRKDRASEVIHEVSARVGGQQTFLGPTLAIPYSIPGQSSIEPAKHGIYLVFPAHAAAVVKTKTEERRRSLFKVPVFEADLRLDSDFDLKGVPASAPQSLKLDWNRAEVVVGVSDARGAMADATITADGKTSTLAPAEIATDIDLDSVQATKLTLFGKRVEDIAKAGAQFKVTSDLRFSGAQRIAVLAYGKTTQVALQGDWPNPGFDGGFLPVNRTVSKPAFRRNGLCRLSLGECARRGEAIRSQGWVRLR